MMLLQQGFESDIMKTADRAAAVPLGGGALFAEHCMECMMFDGDTEEEGCGTCVCGGAHEKAHTGV